MIREENDSIPWRNFGRRKKVWYLNDERVSRHKVSMKSTLRHDVANSSRLLFSNGLIEYL